MPNGIAFQGEMAYLSNWYPIPVCYKDKTFKSAEHAFLSTRAAFHGYQTLALRIELSPTPRAAQNLSHKIKPRDEAP